MEDQQSGINRARDFLRELTFRYYEERLPLQARYTVAARPIPFQDLDRRSWRAVRTGQVWGQQWQSAWFRFRGRIPPEWKDREVVAVIDTESEGCVFDSAGTPLCGLTSKTGLDDPLYRKAMVPVAPCARGLEAVDLLVEAAATNTMGLQREARLKECCLAVFRRDLWSLYHDLVFLVDLAENLPAASPRRAAILAALEAAREGAPSGWESAAEADVADCRRQLALLLKRGAAKNAPRVSAVGHAHLDIAWLWPLEETVRKAGRTFSSALAYMKEYPDYVFAASQPQLYQFVKDSYPGLYAALREAVKLGRWEPQGAMWVEPDVNLAGGEALVRQILYGKRFYRREFGVEADTVWLPDSFGFSPVLPQLMRGSGLRYFMSQKLSWNKTNKFPYHSFWWRGTGGSKVLAHFLPADTMNATMRPGMLLYAAENYREKHRCGHWLCLYGEGDGGGGPGRHHLELAKRSSDPESLPRVCQEKAGAFFRALEREARGLPEWRGELYLETHRGTLTTAGSTKRCNRLAEGLLHDLELLHLMNHLLLDAAYPRADLERLWKLLLLNQFHDILPGTTIDPAYQESNRQFEALLREGQRLLGKALERLTAAAVPGAEGSALLLFNTTGFPRRQVHHLQIQDCREDESLHASDGRPVPVQKARQGLFVECDLPACGYRVLRRRTGAQQGGGALQGNDGAVEVGKNLLENDKIRLEFSENGTLKRIYDKEAEREVLEPGREGNRLLLFREDPGEYDAWDIDPRYRERAPRESKLVSTTIAESGTLCGSILQQRTVSDSSISQEIRITRDSKLIEFITTVDWQEKHQMLKVAFPLNIHAAAAAFDIQFGNIQRPTRRSGREAAQFEVFAHKWIDLSERGYGAALLNDCKYGHSVWDNILELTLLRAPMYPNPNVDRGTHSFTYALLPHNGDFRSGEVIPAAYFLNLPLLCRRIEAHPTPEDDRPAAGLESRSLFSLDREGVVLETVKLSEQDRAVILRLYEAFGRRGAVSVATLLPVSKAAETDLLEEDPSPLEIRHSGPHRHVTLQVKAYQIKTVKLWID